MKDGDSQRSHCSDSALLTDQIAGEQIEMHDYKPERRYLPVYNLEPANLDV
jgi:hypothetical protein